MKSWLAILILAITTPAAATECARHPSDDGSWTWRLVDGDKCWYRGRHVLAKNELHWAKREPQADLPKPLEKPSPAEKPSWLERVSEHAAPAEIYFPAMVPGNALETWPRLIWPQPWLSADSMLHWPVLLDVDRRPFTAWTTRIGQ